MRMTTVMVASTLMLSIHGCASGGGAAEAPGAAPSAGPRATQSALIATMAPTNASGNRIAGRVRLIPSARGDEMTADIDIRGGAYQNKYAWEVRAGQCGEAGLTVGTTVAYPLIETRGDGMSQMKRPVKIAIPEGQTHHVVIFPNATSRSQVVSCGVLSPEG